MKELNNIYTDLDNPDLFNLARKGANLQINWKGEQIKLPKIKNGHRKEYHKTETQLKVLKLMPDAPPIGYGLQQFSGNIFYIYDINKTKKLEFTNEEKLELNKYKKNLELRKTCPICGKVQMRLGILETRRLIDGEEYFSCPGCYKLKDEEMRKNRRGVKHDFTSYFINKGINLNILIDKSEIFDTIYLDFETTGLSSIHDEVIQASVIDDKGRVLFYRLFKPIKLNTWDEAMEINNITPRDVENELPFETYVNELSNILQKSNTIVCYNCSFEIGFLNKYGVKYANDNSYSKFKDCMLMFAEVYGEWNEYYESFKWQDLSTAARYYKYNFEQQQHNSLADVFATKFVYEKIEQEICNP